MGTSETVRPHSPGRELQVCTPDGRVFRFAKTFHVGREHDCELRLQDGKVSRKHLEVSFQDGHWSIRDLESANGVFVNGQRVRSARIEDVLTISLGIDGPSLQFEVDRPGKARKTPPAAARTIQDSGRETKLLARYKERYFGSGALQGSIGGRTMMIRKAFENIHRKERRRFIWAVSVTTVIALAAAAYAFHKHQQVKQQQALALAFFYDMKALDVAIANIEKVAAESGNTQMQEQIRGQRARRKQMESTYDSYLDVLNLYDRRLSEEDRLILRVTRRFGECELAAPPEYMQQVKKYIQKWRSSDSYAHAIKTANQMGYTAKIAEEFTQLNLNADFFYLAMKESGFDAYSSGPPTRVGYAKGMWQFIPETAARYGLTIGPLAGYPRPDVRDDRHDWQKETHAAARYIKDLYSTDAQASGLLVIASYNWGEGRVINMVHSLPPNPAERNFWKLLERYHDRVPDETYQYVFYIVAAAVIGEDPKLFGFPFDNPLGFVDRS